MLSMFATYSQLQPMIYLLDTSNDTSKVTLSRFQCAWKECERPLQDKSLQVSSRKGFHENYHPSMKTYESLL